MIFHLTPQQLRVTRHALGLEGTRKETCRNRFICSFGSEDYETWQNLVDMGLANSYPPFPDPNGNLYFVVNKIGALLSLKYGERLERSWFDPIKSAKEIDQ